MTYMDNFSISWYLPSVFEKDEVLENTDEKVLLIVAQQLIMVPLLPLAVSKAIIIVSFKSTESFGTHKIFPLLAIIWSRILVAMLWTFFFLSVD